MEDRRLPVSPLESSPDAAEEWDIDAQIAERRDREIGITHYCKGCGVPLDDRWPYAACQECGNLPCRHGNRPGECDRCNVEGDIAFDSERERR